MKVIQVYEAYKVRESRVPYINITNMDSSSITCINAYTTHPECMSLGDCIITYKEAAPTTGREVKARRWTAIRNQRGICPACSDVISHGELEVPDRTDLDQKVPYMLPLLPSATHIALHGECNRARRSIMRMIRKGEWCDDDVTPVRYYENGHKRQRIN